MRFVSRTFFICDGLGRAGSGQPDRPRSNDRHPAAMRAMYAGDGRAAPGAGLSAHRGARRSGHVRATLAAASLPPSRMPLSLSPVDPRPALSERQFMIKDIVVNLSTGTARDGAADYAISIARTFDAISRALPLRSSRPFPTPPWAASQATSSTVQSPRTSVPPRPPCYGSTARRRRKASRSRPGASPGTSPTPSTISAGPPAGLTCQWRRKPIRRQRRRGRIVRAGGAVQLWQAGCRGSLYPEDAARARSYCLLLGWQP